MLGRKKSNQIMIFDFVGQISQYLISKYLFVNIALI